MSQGRKLLWGAVAVIAIAAATSRLMQPGAAQTWAGLWRRSPLLPLSLVVPLLIGSLDACGLGLVLVRSGRRLRFRQLLALRLGAETLSLTVPTGSLLSEGMTARLLQTRYGVPTMDAIAALLRRKWLQIFSQGLCLAGAAAVGGLIGPPMGPGTKALVRVALTCGAGLVLVALLAARGLRYFSRFREWTALRPWPVAFAYAGTWVTEAADAVLLATILGAFAHWPRFVLVEATVSLARALAFVSPGGLGVQELGYVAAFHAVDVPGATDVAMIVALVKRGREALWITVGAMLLASGRRSQEVLGHHDAA
jgi:hypothetical protein